MAVKGVGDINWLNLEGIRLVLMVLGGVILLAIGYLARKFLAGRKVERAESLAKKIIAEAEKDAEARKREVSLEAKEELYRTRAKFEEETRGRRQELLGLERRLGERETNLERKVDLLEKKEREISERGRQLVARQRFLGDRERELKALLDEEKERLQRISGLNCEEARKLLLKKMEDDVRQEAAVMLRRIEGETRETAEKKAREIITLAIQRCAADQVTESTVTVVSLPSDEMKGRIIGREGRNIRALEMATGINIIIDDTPEAVTLSGFDPVRREIARITLERLIADGRIHPARIEEVVGKVRQEMEVSIREIGEQAAFEAGVHGLHPEEIKLLGRLKYRTSYGQNVLQHSKEVAHLARIMSSELGMDTKLAKRAGLLHDIGKAVDHEVEGAHARIGADLARRYGESPQTIQAIVSHHGEEEPKTILAVLIQAADAISASRPGARRETLETYIQRLEKLERIADSFPGVGKAYAIQAGREIRVMVEPDRISDAEATSLARDLSKKIEGQMEYPGQIKVTVIRETRAVDYAR
ncbi:ribonuclease Y [candidate division NPL-UPA2 bacterium]|nr:ribonuclease Y [candidate division NPL-UPA2 bacterium]